MDRMAVSFLAVSSAFALIACQSNHRIAGAPDPRPGAPPAQSAVPPKLLVLDLANAKEKDSLLVSPDRYTVEVISKVPKYVYTVTVSQHAIRIPSLDPASTKSGAIMALSCNLLDSAIAKLKRASAEAEVPDLVAAIEAASPGRPECQDRRSYALASTTYRTPAIYNVSAGTYLQVDVARHDSAGGSPKSWTMIYTTGPAGEWSPTYGFAFPILSGIAKHGIWADQQTYFAKDAGGGKFVVTRDARAHRLAMVPVILFNFLPEIPQGGSLGFTGGLGLDPSDPTALGGISLAYWSNLQFSFGLSAHRESRLLGKYVEGDTVTTNLSTDQLHDQDWRLRPFFSLSFRFSGNPFKATPAPARTEAKPEATPPKS